MQVTTETALLPARPGEQVDIVVQVVNTTDLIDGITASLIGLPDAEVQVEPALLPLFPEASGQLRVRVRVPTTVPAGVHPVSVRLQSHAGAPERLVDVDLSVSAQPAVALTADPGTIRARRGARFVLQAANTGNTGLDISLGSRREDRRTTVTFSPETFTLAPGTQQSVICHVRGPRLFTGGDVDRRVEVDLTGRRLHTIAAMLETEDEPELHAQTSVVLRQRPLVSRGLLTALILIGIVTLWALVFLLGLSQVFGGDPLTKTAPTSFPTSVVRAQSEGAAGSDSSDGPATQVPGAAPPGALAKTGLVPAQVGGEITGRVSAASNGEPVGRILVRAFRAGRNGPVLVSSAATQSDGTYSVSGLFPTSYRLQFSAKGFEPVWYPQAPARRGATAVAVHAQGEQSQINTVVTGKPASIEGSIDPGEALEPPITQVQARMLGQAPGTAPDAGQPPAATTTSDASGTYRLTGLVAPATYELTFTAPGYQVTQVLTTVNGGENRLQPGVVPGAGKGSISGIVQANGTPLGNVTVATTVAGETVQVLTPTQGTVGRFTVGNLPTPGTYVLTFTSPGHGSTTRIVDLAAGDSSTGLRVDLQAGAGSVQGRLVSADGAGLGGATVTVGGARLSEGSAAPSTTTLTDGSVGTFNLAGLAPGDYTLTFELEGYTAETVPVTLGSTGAVTGLEVVLGTRSGRVSGRVSAPDGSPYSGASVSVTNGSQTWSTTSTAPGGSLPTGGYQVGSLPPGTYSVTVTADGLRQQTALVSVRAGVTSVQQLRLRNP